MGKKFKIVRTKSPVPIDKIDTSKSLSKFLLKGHNNRPLYDYQKKIMHWAKDRTSMGLFLEMRLGKSLIALRWAIDCIANRSSTLGLLHAGVFDPIQTKGTIDIVAPKTTAISWDKEILAEGGIPIDDTLDLYKMPIPKSHRYCIINIQTYEGYDPIAGWAKRYGCLTCPGRRYEREDQANHALILDESSYIKNPDANRTQVLLKDASGYNYTAILSGLPNPKDILDLPTQLAMLNWGFFESHDLRKKKFTSIRDYAKFSPNSYPPITLAPKGYTAIKRVAAEHTISLTRKDLGLGPQKVYTTIPIRLTEYEKMAYDDAENRWINTDGTLLKWNLQRSMSLAKQAMNAKMRKLNDILHDEFLLSSHIVLWTRFNDVFDWAKHQAGSLFFKDLFFLKGDMTKSKRKNQMEKFQRSKAGLLIAQVKCGKFGLDMSFVDTAIYLSVGYDLEDRYQSEDRLISVNRKSSPKIVDLIAENTIEEAIYECLMAKTKSSTEFLDHLSIAITARQLGRWQQKQKSGSQSIPV